MLGIVIGFAIIVFAIAVLSPRLSRKVERKTNHKTSRLKQKAIRLWGPLTFIAHGGLELLKRLTAFSARKGRVVSKKVKSDKE